ncbi:MAG: hypothetical protein ABIJ23_01070, partial [Candidatus Magasanikbacteria bacterium]
NIKICDKFTDSGDCDNWLTVSQENQTYDKNDSGNVKKSDISNMTGYVKVGYEGVGFGTSSVSMYPNDYYPLGTAESVGLSASVPNGGFELPSTALDETTGKTIEVPPQYWDCSNNISKCKILYNPFDIQESGSCYTTIEGSVCKKFAPEGKQFLSLPGGESAETHNSAITGSSVPRYIQVVAQKEYFLTLYVNTVRLTKGEARIKVEQYNNEGETVRTDDWFLLDKMQPWTFVLKKITTVPTANKIKIILSSYDTNGYSSVDGNFVYFDDVKIRTVLESQDNWRTPQFCRLYPQQDSLSCDYYADSGIRYKGVSGYCLEYDRYPGSSDACLLWWSVPDGEDRLNEYCGDSMVNGDEDCDCGEDKIACVNDGPADSRYNQYMCIGCRQAEGWCGDNVAQDGHGETCDCGDGIPESNVNPECDGTGINGGSVCKSNCQWNHCQFDDAGTYELYTPPYFPCVIGDPSPSSEVTEPSNSGSP